MPGFGTAKAWTALPVGVVAMAAILVPSGDHAGKR